MTDLELMKKTYTVHQITSAIKNLLEDDFMLKNVEVKGEASNVTYHRSGHVYFSLKDEKAVISCVMFAGSAASLKFRIEEGKKIVVRGSVTVYEASGRYQINVKRAEEEGKGELFQKFEELKAKLSESGMFAAEYKRKIPQFSYRIGVVTSETGAVIRDIYNVSSRRNPYCQIYLYSATVQGEGAAKTIVKGIETLDKMGLDCLIVGRGGGSIEDLWCFNEEEVARAIFNAETPVISAVGHETDFTIADFVADLRAPTPSAAAELAVFDYYQFEKELDDYRYTLKQNLENSILKAKEKTKHYRLEIQKRSPESQIYQKRMRLQEISNIFDNEISKKLRSSKEMLETYKTSLPEFLEAKLKITKERTDSFNENMRNLLETRLKTDKDKVVIYAERLNGLSPLRRLSSGYAYASVQGKTLKSINQINEDEEFLLNLKDGEIEAKVLKTREVKYER